MPDRPLCRHCGRRFVTRPRGLCWRCFYAPGIKERYAPLPGYYGRPDQFNRLPDPAGEPTDALPGSEAKVAILERRAATRQALWHPQDRWE